MSQAPAMPMYWGDYWSKTRRLTPAQHHAYLFLLGATWMNNGIAFPDDDEVLAAEIGISVAAWRKVRPALVRFFDLSEGTWRNRKLDEVWAAVMKKVESNRTNGPLGGRPRKHRPDEKTQENQRPEKPNGFVQKTQPKPNQSQSQIKEEDDANASSEKRGANGSIERGSRIAVDWRPRPEDYEWAEAEWGICRERADRITDEFVDFWLEQPGAKGRKVGWWRTWRNRIRQVAERGGTGQRPGSLGSGDSRILAALGRVRLAPH